MDFTLTLSGDVIQSIVAFLFDPSTPKTLPALLMQFRDMLALSCVNKHFRASFPTELLVQTFEKFKDSPGGWPLHFLRTSVRLRKLAVEARPSQFSRIVRPFFSDLRAWQHHPVFPNHELIDKMVMRWPDNSHKEDSLNVAWIYLVCHGRRYIKFSPKDFRVNEALIPAWAMSLRGAGPARRSPRKRLAMRQARLSPRRLTTRQTRARRRPRQLIKKDSSS